MEILTTKQVAEVLAGGDSYIRTYKGEVKGLAITPKKNPEAPEIIVVGTGPRIVANAQLLLKSELYVPVYLKQGVNQWKFLGNYKADKYSKDPYVIEKHRKHRLAKDIDGILFLTAEDDYNILVTSQRNIPDIETKKRVELTAVSFVTKFYKNRGYRITDVQNDNCGYDLLIESKQEILKMEVKGTNSKEQRFFLSRNERARSADPQWRLAIVTDVLNEPTMEVLKQEEMVKKFKFDALCWECTIQQTTNQ